MIFFMYIIYYLKIVFSNKLSFPSCQTMIFKIGNSHLTIFNVSIDIFEINLTTTHWIVTQSFIKISLIKLNANK